MSARSWIGVLCLSLLAGLAPGAAPPGPGWDADPLYRVCKGLVSWWPADGHALDLVGGNHGDRAPGVRFAKGQRGLAFSFSGQPRETVVNREPALTASFTLALWVQPKAARQLAGPLPSHLGISGQRYAVYPSHGGNAGTRAGCGLSVGTNGIGVFEHTDNNLPAVLAHDVPIKGWVHVAVVYAAGTPTLYVDGKAVKTGQRSRWIVFPGTSFGDLALQGYGPFHGLVDEVMLFNRSLDAAEVAVLLRATRPGRDRLSLSAASFVRLWSCLSEEPAPRALFAVHRLAASGDEAVRRLRPHLRPSADTRKPSVAQLIAQIDDDSFAVRERATRLLIERGPAAGLPLRTALAGKPSAEARRRLMRILRQLRDLPLTAAQMRAVRALSVLARIDSPASRALLAEVADGPDSAVANAARALLGRGGAP